MVLANLSSWDPHRKATRKILTSQGYSSAPVFFVLWNRHSETNLWEVLPATDKTKQHLLIFIDCNTGKKRAQRSSSTISYGIQMSLSFIRWTQEAFSEKTYLYYLKKEVCSKLEWHTHPHTHIYTNPPSSMTTFSCWPSKFLIVYSLCSGTLKA